MNYLIFYGSVRSERKGIKLVKFLQNKLIEHKHEVKVIDPLEYNFGLLDKMYKELKSNAPEKMKELSHFIKEADGFFVVSGEYNHSVPPALTNLMDHFLEEYFFRPSAIVTYSAGRYGGVRSVAQLRSFLGEIGTVSISNTYAVPFIHKAFDDNGNPSDPNYNKLVQRLLNEMDWYASTLKDGRKKYKLPF